MDERRKRRLQWGVALASVVVPLTIVVLSLPYHGGLWLLFALAGAAAASIVLVELGERSEARAKPENTYLPGSLRLLEIQSAEAGQEQGAGARGD